MAAEFVFDRPHYRALDAAKTVFLRDKVSRWKTQLELKTALDVGCGLGHFAAMLQECGFDVTAIEGRPENAVEAQSRVAALRVHIADVENMAPLNLGSFDLVLAFGLLYHLENPLRVIRQLRKMTRSLLLVESMCIQSPAPTLYLQNEGEGADQGLRYVAFYPSEPCLIKMLYCAGYSFVYRFRELPRHPDFSGRIGKRRVRTMLAASTREITDPCLMLADEPPSLADPWMSAAGKAWYEIARIARFALKPWPEKLASVRRRLELFEARRS